MSFLSGIFQDFFHDSEATSGGFALNFFSMGPGGISSLGNQLWGISIGENLASQNNFVFDFTNLMDELPVEQTNPNLPIMREYHPSDTVPDVKDLPPSHNIHIPAPWIDEHGHLTKNVSFDSFEQGDFNWISGYYAANGYEWA